MSLLILIFLTSLVAAPLVVRAAEIAKLPGASIRLWVRSNFGSEMAAAVLPVVNRHA